MRLLYFILLTLTFNSCKKVINSEKKNESTFEIIKKSEPLPFNEMVLKLQNDENISVIDTLNIFPNNKYVIAIMQRHPVPSGADSQTKSVQKEMGKFYLNNLKSYNFTYYFEGINSEIGQINSETDFTYQGISDNQKDFVLLNHCLQNNETVFGLETINGRGSVLAFGFLKRHIGSFTGRYEKEYLNKHNELKIEYVNNLLSYLDSRKPFLPYHNNGSIIDDNLVSHNAFNKEFDNAIEYLMYMKTKNKDSVFDYYRLAYLKSRHMSLTYTTRQEDAVNFLGANEFQVLVFGSRHFRNDTSQKPFWFHSKMKIEYFEDILEEEQFNYIIIKPNSV